MHYSCESAKRISEQFHILLNDQTIMNESYLKSTDAIMSRQLREFERLSRYTVLLDHVEGLTSQMQSIPSIQGNVIHYLYYYLSMASFNFDLEIFCDTYYCGKFGALIDSQIARVFTI